MCDLTDEQIDRIAARLHAYVYPNEHRPRTCANPNCARRFLPDHDKQDYCSLRCGDAHRRRKYRAAK